MDEKKLKRRKEKAIQEKNYDLFYNYCKDLADIYLREENNELALQEYKEAERAAKKLNNKMYFAIANRMIGETLCALGEFDEAIKHQKVHLAYSREENNLVEEQRALATLGRTYFVQAESITNSRDPDRKKYLDLCRKYYVKSLNICERLASTSQLSSKTLSEMKLRLFLNLGLSLESEGDANSGIEYISKAINICKSLELWEDLVRCYSAQGSLYFRQGNTARALTRYDEAIKVAERLEQRVQISCELLSSKADVLIALSDYNSAKNVLIKAYKMRTPDNKERREIELKLKTVYSIWKTENELLEISETNYSVRRKLCENLADNCVKLKNFNNAITYYQKALEYTLAMGLLGKELGPIYYSLSQTYKDNGQYELALENSLKEFEFSKDNPEEGCKSLLNIIELMELQKQNYDNIMEQYNKALSLAKKSEDLNLQATVLRYLKCTQLEYKRDDLAVETQQELDIIEASLPSQESEEESENLDELETLENVDLAEILDLYSDDEEEEDAAREKHARRRVPKSTLTRRNEKGETPLHVASAKGNIALIKSLIQQGHPVNIQDAAGWSPLHEACNHGQVEAARILIENGAHIDDRGGPCCDGITPLLDAASNGHLELITLLLDKGASSLARTNQGDTALDCLLACRERALAEGEILDPVTQAYFNEVVNRLKTCLNKVGQQTRKSFNSSNTKHPKRSETSQMDTRTEKYSQILDRSRKRIESDFSSDEPPINAAREYQSAMNAVRHGSKAKITEPLKPIEKSKKTALLTDEDVGDDWLEDDLANQPVRPAKRRCEQFVGQQLRNVEKTATSPASTPIIPTTSVWDNFLEDVDFNDDTSTQSLSPMKISAIDDPAHSMQDEPKIRPRTSSQNERPKPKYQKSLLSVGFTRFNPPSHSTQESPSEPVFQPTNRSRWSTPSTISAMKVRVEGKLFLVPVPHNAEALTVSWLVAEASRRYQNVEGIAPALNLMTADGALLDINDPLTIVLNESEICASVVSWNLAPLVDRYKEACLASNTAIDSHLERQLNVCQANGYLEITDCNLSMAVLTPVLKAISHYQNLQNISISTCFLNDQMFKALVDHVTKLNDVRSIDVSVNCITNDGLSHFSRALLANSLRTIEELNFSYNPLGEESVASLIGIANNLTSLRSFNIGSIGLTSASLYGASNLVLGNIESLDVSYNKMDREAAVKFLSTLDSCKIRSLNLSSTGGSEVFRECLLFLDRGHLFSLRELYLSDMDIDDNDIELLVQPLIAASELSKLDLSNNRRITVAAHQFLSKLSHLKELRLTGCDLLTAQHELNLPFCRLTLSSTRFGNEYTEAPYNYVTNSKKIVF